MTKVFEDKSCTELLLQNILDRTDLTVQEVKAQYTVKNLQGRSVRLDVFATDSTGKAYNIEVQRSDSGAIAKRARYNSSLLDANISVPGEELKDLPDTYVIFITENDTLKCDFPLYHIERRISETGELFDDGSHILYVNSQIQDDSKLGRLMHDFYCLDDEDMHYETLARRVQYFKKDEKGVTAMCRSVEQLCKEEREDGIEVGKKVGIEVGRISGKKDVVISMLDDDVPYEKIAKFTGFSIEEIKAIAKEH